MQNENGTKMEYGSKMATDMCLDKFEQLEQFVHADIEGYKPTQNKETNYRETYRTRIEEIVRKFNEFFNEPLMMSLDYYKQAIKQLNVTVAHQKQ